MKKILSVFVICLLFLISSYKSNSKEIEVIPRITNQEFLNQNSEREIGSYNNKKLGSISKGYIVRYSSFSRNDKRFGEEYVYFIFFGKDGYTYRISCSRKGILAMNVYSGSGGFLYYTIPDLSKPNEIYSEDLQTGKQILMKNENLEETDKNQIETMADIVRIFKSISEKTDVELGI